MNDPAVTIIDVEEQRSWLQDLHTQVGSWAQLAKRIAVPTGTISQFGGKSGYSGDEQKVAERVFKYRQMLAAQASLQTDVPDVPGYFETETSNQLVQMLAYSQRGDIVLAAMGAGLGKTMSAQQYAACYANVFLATMKPSTAGINTMQISMLKSMGEKNAVGTPQKLSQRIIEKVERLGNPLMIIDEAQHLSEKAIEEIRSWHDETGCGIALFGNQSVLQRLEGGTRSSAFAQMFSRVSLRLVRNLPLQGDADALAAAWGVFDDATIGVVRTIALRPGGLRGATKALKLASMLSAVEGTVLGAGHLQDAWAQLSSRAVAA